MTLYTKKGLAELGAELEAIMAEHDCIPLDHPVVRHFDPFPGANRHGNEEVSSRGQVVIITTSR